LAELGDDVSVTDLDVSSENATPPPSGRDDSWTDFDAALDEDSWRDSLPSIDLTAVDVAPADNAEPTPRGSDAGRSATTVASPGLTGQTLVGGMRVDDAIGDSEAATRDQVEQAPKPQPELISEPLDDAADDEHPDSVDRDEPVEIAPSDDDDDDDFGEFAPMAEPPETDDNEESDQEEHEAKHQSKRPRKRTSDKAPTSDAPDAPPAAGGVKRFLRAKRGQRGNPQARRKWLMQLGVGLITVVIAVTLLPLFFLVRADRSASDCFDELVAHPDQKPQDCVPSDYMLDVPELLPWFEEEAVQMRVNFTYRAARRDYDKATAIAPNRAERDRSAEQVRLAGSGIVEPEDLPPEDVLRGAFSSLVDFGLATDEMPARNQGFYAARTLGSVESMGALAVGGSEKDDYTLNIRRGAVLCLLDDPDHGALALMKADRAHLAFGRAATGSGEARVALQACAPPDAREQLRGPHNVGIRYRPALVQLQGALGTIEGLEGVRTFLEHKKVLVTGAHRATMAPVVIHETNPSITETLAILVPKRGPAASLASHKLRTPWMVLNFSSNSDGVLVNTAASQGAAEYLERLLPDTPREPMTCDEDPCPLDTALTMPHHLVQEAARTFWLQLAVEWAHRGRRNRAIAAVQRATELTSPRRRYQSAAVHLAVGDAEGALRVLDPALRNIDAYPTATRAIVWMNEALALAHLGRFRKALEAAEHAFVVAVGTELSAREDPGNPNSATDSDQVLEERVMAAWLYGAMALHQDKTGEAIERVQDPTVPSLVALVEWLQLATMPEPERRPLRWDLTMHTPPAPVLPAAMYIVSRAIPSSYDAEVWLDRIFHRVHRQRPVRTMLARAETALWMHDPDSAKEWQSRASGLRELIRDYPTALLSHTANLR